MEVNSKESKYIMKTTKRKPVECKCQTCRDMCRHTVCLGTPADILKIAEAGHLDKLIMTDWQTGVSKGMKPITMIQLRHYDNGHCVMLKNGLCSLHAPGLKPTEGVLTHHKGGVVDLFQHPAYAVARTWLLEENLPIVLNLINQLKNQQDEPTKF